MSARRRTGRIAAVAGGLSLLLPLGQLGASPSCRTVSARVVLHPAAADDPCASPVGICATGELTGRLSGTSEFVGSALVPTVDTPATGVVLLTGDNLIHLQQGDLMTKDAIVLNKTGDGEFAEVDTIVGGTGAWQGASGRLTSTGTFTATDGGSGRLHGRICRA